MDIDAVVERLILERGQLDPLLLLRQIGVLSDSGLTAWRQGQVGSLDDVLTGDPLWIDGCLRQAARMARILGLKPKTVTSHGMDSAGIRIDLKVDAGGNPGRMALLTTQYHRPEPGVGSRQMDLFLDNPETGLINDLLHAIARHDLERVRSHSIRLEKWNPENSLLKELRPMMAAIENREAWRDNPQEGYRWLEREIIPHAAGLLGNLEGMFLKPFHQTLDQALTGVPFDPNEPNIHRSWTLERLGDWKSLVECVLLEEGWTRQPVLLTRLAMALHKLRRLEANRQVWIRFFWEFPEIAGRTLETRGDKDLLRMWHAFLDRNPAEKEMFPAWMLLEQPRLAENEGEWLDMDGPDPVPGKQAFSMLAELLRLEQEMPDSVETLAQRRRLKEAFPEVFSMFLQTVHRTTISR
ncbi:MAG: hypothetical protein HQL76_10620 [Magnetococcales bacterium]|nr:hypothetical protein [Magnetococcales bacterium]